MRRVWQVFDAPPDETNILPIEPSPWHIARTVYIPWEHWDVILKFAESIDSHKTKLLSSSSSTKNKNLNIERSQDELQEMIDFIERIIGKIAVSPPLVPKPTPEIPEDYTNVEHIRMLEAVKGVMKEVKRIGKPLKAWIE